MFVQIFSKETIENTTGGAIVIDALNYAGLAII